MIFKISFLGLLLCFLNHCSLKLGEPAPPRPIFQLDPPPSFCANLNYKKEFSDYFFNSNSLNAKKVALVLECLSYTVDEIQYSIANENLTKKDVKKLIEQKLIDFGDDFNKTLLALLDFPYFDSFLFIKNHFFQIIKEDFDIVNFHENFQCSNTKKLEEVISKSEALYINPFLTRLAVWFEFIETEALHIQQDFFKQYQIVTKDLLSNKEYMLLFHAKLIYKLKESFPEYARFLKTPKKLFPASESYPLPWIQFNTKAILPLIDMLSLPKPQNQTPTTVLNVKYMLFNIYLTQVFFNIYDRNQDSLLSQEELGPLACMLSPFIEWFLQEQLKDSSQKLLQLFNLNPASPIVHYIISRQEIPDDLGFVWYRMIQDPESYSYSLDHGDLTRLIALFFSQGVPLLEKYKRESPTNKNGNF